MDNRLELRFIPESQLYAELVAFERRLHTLLLGLIDQQPFARSAELQALANEIAHQPAREDQDLQAWARRLAEDVSRLTD